MADAVESPVRGDTHAGFGERPAETDRRQRRHRAAGRLNQWIPVMCLRRRMRTFFAHR